MVEPTYYMELVKMEKITEVIHNAETGEITERELTLEEAIEFTKMQKQSNDNWEAEKIKTEAKAAAKAAAQAKLAALGLTAEEIAAL